MENETRSHFYESWGDAPENVQKDMFSGYCTEEEQERAAHPKNAKDFLLRLRAVYIADHTRLWRVFLHLSRIYGEKWSLEGYFNSDSYDRFRALLSKSSFEKCKDVTCGSIYDNNANGLIFTSEFGVLSTYSCTLQYFSKYANLALGLFDEEVPPSVKLSTMRIACRVLLNTEAQDFLFDPRGKIPKSINEILNIQWKYNSVFLAGHELCHSILGHLTDDKCEEIGFTKPHFKDDTDYRKINGYRVSQLHEFDADVAALNLVELDDKQYRPYFESALNWFAILAIYEGVEDSICPPSGNQTHPGAIARYTNILEKARKPKGFNEKLFVEKLPEVISQWRDYMINDASLNIEQYEMYGSVYLAKPNTKWRGRELIDRVDY